ncbi:hypothetical protein MMC07_000674 [Pseudocyphellaria aurata]|nr:hypothetical protein [Pseudocyphellaria aurata]
MAFPSSPDNCVQHAHDSTTSSSRSDANHLTWTPEHEARLVHVQAQLSAAQAKWSEEQELWLDEVHGLEELRRAHKKAVKKEAKRFAKKTAGMWRAKANNSPGSGGTSEEEGDDSEEATKARAPQQSGGFGGLLRRWSTRGGKGAESPPDS